jgi:hypothetical protein
MTRGGHNTEAFRATKFLGARSWLDLMQAADAPLVITDLPSPGEKWKDRGEAALY